MRLELTGSECKISSLDSLSILRCALWPSSGQKLVNNHDHSNNYQDVDNASQIRKGKVPDQPSNN